MELYTYDSDLTVDWGLVDAQRRSRVAAAKGLNARRRSSISIAQVIQLKKEENSIGIRGMKDVTLRRDSHSNSNPSTLSSERATNLESNESAATAAKSDAPVIRIPVYTPEIWLTDPDLIQLRHHASPQFLKVWKGAINAYISGNWDHARDVLKETMRLTNETDGPSKHLLMQMEAAGGTAPKDWPGYRDEYDGGH